jgi:hypothetical protein
MSENHRLKEAIKAGVEIPRDGYWGNVPSRLCGPYAGKVDDNIKNELSKSEKK